MNDILRRIVADLQPELARRRRLRPLTELAELAATLPPPPDFATALRRHKAPAIIAEIKQASPSRGVIRRNFAPLRLALELEAAGAAALSVLTEPNYFRGRPEYLAQIAGAVKIPLLCKDFICDEYQLCEARVNGAAAVLLIAALLDDAALRRLTACAHRLGLRVLGEAHDRAELDRLLASEVDMVGVNARNLRDFSTDPAASAALLAAIPGDRLPVAESAIRSPADISSLQAAGATAFLIGEALMRAPSAGAELLNLRGRAR